MLSMAWCWTTGRAAQSSAEAPRREVPEVWSYSGTQDGASFGAALAGGGDLNGDGFADLVLGEGGFRSEAGVRCGRLQIFFGSPLGFGAKPDQVILGDGDDVGLGSWVAVVRDVNRDGFADVGVTSVSVEQGPHRRGRVEVWLGSARGLVRDPAWNVAGERRGVGVWLVAAAGDVNGDGYADVVFGATDPGSDPPAAGVLQVFHGSAAGLSLHPAWERRGTQPDENYGSRAESAGDVNGDGYGDLVVGTMNHDGQWVDEGRVELFLGSPTGLQVQPAWSTGHVPTTAGGPARAHLQLFGACVAGAGDVNRDGFADLLASGPYIDHAEDDEGRAFLWFGRPERPVKEFAWSAGPGQPRASFGHRVGGVGDVDGDGFPDVVVTAPHLDHGSLNEGAAALYAGGPQGLSEFPVWTAEGDQPQAAFGSTLAALGDVNRDGLADFAVGTDRWVENGRTVGQVRVFYGRRGGLVASTGWNRAPSAWERWQHDLIAWSERAGGWVAALAVPALGLGAYALLRAASAYQRSRRQMHRLRERVEALARAGSPEVITVPEARWQRVAEELRTSLEAPGSASRSLAEVVRTMETWAQEFARTRGLRVELDFPGDLGAETRVSAQAAEALEATIRVALANVMQHARASRAWVRMERLTECARLEVGDDGVGFDTSRLSSSSAGTQARHGLNSLKTRVRRADGRLEVRSQPGNGSQIMVRVPTELTTQARRGWWGRLWTRG